MLPARDADKRPAVHKEDVQTMEQCKVADGAKLCLVCVPTAEDQQNKMEAGASFSSDRDHAGNC